MDCPRCGWKVDLDVDPEDAWLDLQEVADEVGISRNSAKMYLQAARHPDNPTYTKFAVGFPLEDGRVGQSPVWLRSTVVAWAQESGRGRYRVA